MIILAACPNAVALVAGKELVVYSERGTVPLEAVTGYPEEIGEVTADRKTGYL